MKRIRLKGIAIILSLLISNTLFSQNQANNWLFGNFGLKFNNDTVVVTKDYAEHLNRGIGIISNENGELLFYTDGYSVWNRNHSLMPNGTVMIPSTTGSKTQESIIIPEPESNNIYYIFSVDPWNGQDSSGLYYSIVDLSLESGMGDVILKRNKLLDNTTNKISAVFHENQKDIWILTHKHNTNKYYTLLITKDGVSDEINEQIIGKSHSFWDGQLKFSPDGKKVACSYSGNLNGEGFDLFEFNNATGELSNSMSFLLPDRSCDGIEFSSDATKLLVYQFGSTGESGLYQYDLTDQSFDEINNTRVLLTRDKYNSFKQMQLAPNGNIYITKGGGGGGTEHLGVIENPNEYGEKCIVRENGLYLEGGSSFVTSTPNFIQNYFFKQTRFNIQDTCQTDFTKFNIPNTIDLDSVLWSFGEGTTSKEISPEFQYEEAGEYNVQLIVYYPNKPDTVNQTVKIYPYTEINLGRDTSLCLGEKFMFEDKLESYIWNTSDTTQAIKITESGRYKLTVKNEYGCYSTDSIFISVLELPEINLPDSAEIAELDSIQLNPGEFESYYWNTGDTTQSIYVMEEAWYSVDVENELGCHAVKSVFISEHFQNLEKEESDWILLNPKPSVYIGLDCYFLSDEIGFIVNEKEILRTIDGGQNWDILTKISSGKRIAFKNSIGYVVGVNGDIYKSTHWGEQWNKLNVDFHDHLNAITLIHQDTLFVTSNNKLFVSDDGGKTWDTHDIRGVNVKDSYFTSSKVGHVVCRNGAILKTIDGGVTWYSTETTNSIPSDFFRVTFVDEKIGYASREHNEIFKTFDGGETWNRINSPSDAIYSFHFLDKDVGFVSGEYGAMYKTIDGGNSWEWIGFDGRKGGNTLNSIFFVNENEGYATGARGRILKTNNGGKTWASYSQKYYTIEQIDFLTNEIGYVLVGNEVFKTFDGGITWENIGAPIEGIKTRKFDFLDENIGFAIVGGRIGTSANSGFVYKTTDGGINWSGGSEVLRENLYSIDFYNENIGFVSGGFNLDGAYKTTDSGNSWKKIESISFGQMQFLTTDIGYARNVGNLYNRIYKTVDGGNTWEITFEIDENINCFHFLDKNHGYFIGDHGLMFKTKNGGATWEKVEIDYDYYDYVKFYSQNVGYILNEDGELFKTENGGVSWTKENSFYGIYDIDILNQNIYLSGSNGQIYKGKVNFEPIVLNLSPVEEILNRSVTLLGNVTSNGDSVKNIVFEFSQDHTFKEEVKGSVEFVEPNVSIDVSAKLLNLEPDKEYYCRLKATYNGKEYMSETQNFKTLPDYELDLKYYVDALSNEATVYGTISTFEDDITGIEFQYSTDTSFNFAISAIPDTVLKDSTKNITGVLTSLNPETSYNIRIKGIYLGEEIYSSSTSFYTRPEIEFNINRPYLYENVVSLTAYAIPYKDTLKDIVFEYDTTRDYTNFVSTEPDQINKNQFGSISAQLSGLDSATVYFYRLKGTLGGDEIYSAENIFCINGGVQIFPIEVEQLSDTSIMLQGLIN